MFGESVLREGFARADEMGWTRLCFEICAYCAVSRRYLSGCYIYPVSCYRNYLSSKHNYRTYYRVVSRREYSVGYILLLPIAHRNMADVR